jgi:type I restriction enzyme M protein
MRRWRGPWFVDFEPVCYVRAEAEKMKRLVVQLREQQSEAAILDAAIAANLKETGYGG